MRESTLAHTQPDWLYDVKTDRFDVFQYDGMPLAPPPALPPVECTAEKLFARPVIRGTGRRVESKRAVVCWEQLAEHHYLSSNLLTLAYQHCWALRMDDDPTRALAAFVALSRDEMHTAKQGDSRKRYKEHRLVEDQQWQGIGLGPSFQLDGLYEPRHRGPQGDPPHLCSDWTPGAGGAAQALGLLETE